MTHDTLVYLVLQALLPAGIFAYLSYYLWFCLQCRFFELFTTLLVSALPFFLMLTFAQNSSEAKSSNDKYVAAVYVGVLAALLIFAGSIWGLSAIKRLEERRQGRRYALIVAGWGLVAGIISSLPFFGFTIAGSVYLVKGDTRFITRDEIITYVIFFISIIFAIPGLMIEDRYRKLKRRQVR